MGCNIRKTEDGYHGKTQTVDQEKNYEMVGDCGYLLWIDMDGGDSSVGRCMAGQKHGVWYLAVVRIVYADRRMAFSWYEGRELAEERIHWFYVGSCLMCYGYDHCGKGR